MNTEEAIKRIDEVAQSQKDAKAAILASGLIADAINRLAKAQERQAQIQEKQWELAQSMMSKAGPLMDKTLDVMNRETEGDEWKKNEIEEDTSDHDSEFK